MFSFFKRGFGLTIPNVGRHVVQGILSGCNCHCQDLQPVRRFRDGLRDKLTGSVGVRQAEMHKADM